VIGAAVMFAKIATGKVQDMQEDDGKAPKREGIGARGGRARADAMTPERHAEIARKAAAKRRSAK